MIAQELKRNLRERRIALIKVGGKWQRIAALRKNVEGGPDVAETIAGWVPITDDSTIHYFDNPAEAYQVLLKGE